MSLFSFVCMLVKLQKSHCVNRMQKCSISSFNPNVVNFVNLFIQTRGEQDMLYMGGLSNFELLLAWANDKCIPLVREITFENGEVRTKI